MSAPFRICFVCSGNICRSPTAEAVMRHQIAAAGLADRIVVDSAGLGHWHVGQDADPRSLATLRAAGYTLDHEARVFDPDWYGERDLIVAIDRGHLRALQQEAPDSAAVGRVVLLRDYAPGGRPADSAGEDVGDPYYGGPDGFEIVLAQIEEACAGLLRTVGPEAAQK